MKILTALVKILLWLEVIEKKSATLELDSPPQHYNILASHVYVEQHEDFLDHSCQNIMALSSPRRWPFGSWSSFCTRGLCSILEVIEKKSATLEL